jgi:hypothetical protein
MCVSEKLQWFACLFGKVRRTARDKGAGLEATNRTVIALTAKPLALLTLMNASEETEVAEAADKARRLLDKRCETTYEGMDIPRRFEILCTIGPIIDYVQAKTITHEWITSRGGTPRATCAQQLAIKYDLKFNAYFSAIFALADLDVDVIILKREEHSTEVAVRLK